MSNRLLTRIDKSRRVTGRPVPGQAAQRCSRTSNSLRHLKDCAVRAVHGSRYSCDVLRKRNEADEWWSSTFVGKRAIEESRGFKAALACTGRLTRCSAPKAAEPDCCLNGGRLHSDHRADVPGPPATQGHGFPEKREYKAAEEAIRILPDRELTCCSSLEHAWPWGRTP